VNVSQIFLAVAWLFGAITWLLTTYLAFVNWGFLGAAASFFIPPLDIVFMFMLGTWPLGLVALGAFALAMATAKE
jgi:hypothetical protein